MALIRYQPFDDSLRATVLYPRDCVANMGHIDFGMTARLISGGHLLHSQTLICALLALAILINEFARWQIEGQGEILWEIK